MHRSVLSGTTTTAVFRGESNSASANPDGEGEPSGGQTEGQVGDHAQSIKANSGTALVRLTALLLAVLLFYAGWPGLSAPPGAFRPPLATIGNPKPILLAHFGFSLASVGDDLILIGVPYDNFYEGLGGGLGGSAYLVDTNGNLATTFTNPPQKLGDYFGHAVAALGTGRVLVSARLASVSATNAGAVYLFNTNGTLLTTFTNMPVNMNDHFGDAVAGVGTDRVLVGAATGGTNNGGAAYLFATNGTLLRSFQNPTPQFLDFFGGSIAAVGNDLIVIGAYGDDTGGRDSGAAYLFNSTGALLTTYTNPAPVAGGLFGWSVAGMGSDRILIGAEGNTVGGTNVGAAYLFATNGTVPATFTNPTLTRGGSFGHSLATVGGDRVLIGAFLNDIGAGKTGAAYLFDTNGTPLATFANPTPEASTGPGSGGVPPTTDRFGFAVTALGNDLFVIAADGDNGGAPGAGSVYIYGVPRQPPLGISANASSVSLRWAGPEPSFILQQSGWLNPTSVWSDVEESPQVNGPTNLVLQPLTTTNRFYRLRWP